jgi:hypothetical protein
MENFVSEEVRLIADACRFINKANDNNDCWGTKALEVKALLAEGR